MNINDNIKNRSDLKSYFIKNAIPTESNFAELIESVINQREDGLVKLPGAPLSIEASGDASSQKKVINLYDDFVQENPDWVISLNPRQDPSKPETARAGYSVSDNAGNSRLFIDKTTGKIGIGTINPGDELEVSGNMRILTDTNPLRFTSGWSNFPAQGVDHAEISNDTGTYKTLMIVGNRSNDAGVRRVSIWDRLVVHGYTETLGISVNNAANTGVGRGVWLWSPGDSNHVIYSANPSGMSPANKTATRGHFDANHRLRFRTATGQGFLFENNNEQALVDIDSDNGNLWAKGIISCGNAIMPSAGNSTDVGIRFPSNPGGGGGDSAWIRYYPRTGEATTFEIGTSNDPNDHIALMASGNVGIGTQEPLYDLDVMGTIRFGGFTENEADEWPRVVWYRDTSKGWDEGLIKHGTSRGFFGRAGFGIHTHQSRDWHIFSTGWRPLLGVEGGTGNIKVRGTIDYSSLAKLNVANNFTATIGCADFTIGYSGRRGSPGRALVDGNNTLHVNYGPDWKYTQVHGVVSHPSSKKLKENIERLTPDEVYHSLENLEPVKFSMKSDPDKNMQLGFIAEDVPAELATRERDAIIPVHITAVLVGVVRDLEARIRQLETDH